MRFRYSGHETFPCRYAWLPKAFAAIDSDRSAFSDEESAMIRLGVGKNMVRAIRFWMVEMSVAIRHEDGGYQPSAFARSVLDKKKGIDPFLQDIRTLWLLHWNLCTHNLEDPLFAWEFLINHWQSAEISRSIVLQAFRKAADKETRPPSDVTLGQHFDTFLHTYVPTRSRKGEIQEDNLDCPLVELDFIQHVGERRLDGTGKREPIYAFRLEDKPEITPELFAYCLDDYWKQRRNNEKTLTFKDVTFGQGSPGQVFKLPEWSVRERLESIALDADGAFRYAESATQQQIYRRDGASIPSFATAYGEAVPC
jgi:Protein of unknown function (DUF4007)